MTWLNATYPIAQAVSQGADIWELFLENWGDLSSVDTDGTNLGFPAEGQVGLASLAAMSIGPQSNVDRCGVFYALPSTQWAFNGHARRWLTVDNPLRFTQPGDGQVLVPGARAGSPGNLAISSAIGTSTTGNGLLSTRFTNAYLKASGAGPNNFGAAAVAAGAKWLPPLLHLYCYLRPPIVAPPSVRAPLRYSDEVVLAVGGGVETLAFQIPIFGRKSITIDLLTPAADVSYRVGGIAFLPTPTVLIPPQEVALVVAAGPLAANVKTRLAVITDPRCDYLMIYYNKAGALSAQTLRAFVQAFD